MMYVMALISGPLSPMPNTGCVTKNLQGGENSFSENLKKKVNHQNPLTFM